MKQDVEHAIIKIFMNRILLAIVFLCLSIIVFAQENIPVGTWRTHFNYEKSFDIEMAGDLVYCLTTQGLFYYNTIENSTSILTKVNGLSDTEISAMAYDQELKVLSLGYSNGNIDLVFENEIFNITTLKQSSITDNKRINHIATNDGKIYLSTNFGVLILNPNSGEIDETYQNLGSNGASIKISKSIFTGNFIYLATSIGVLRADIGTSLNLQDFNNWTRFEGSIIANEDILSITEVGGDIFASSSQSIFQFNNNFWTNIGFDTSLESIHQLKKKGNNLLVILESSIQERSSDGSINLLKIGTDDNPKDIIIENAQIFWYADFKKGLTKSSDGTIERKVPNGIFSSAVERLEYVDNSIIAFPKAAFANKIPLENGLGFVRFKNGFWVNTASKEIMNVDDLTDAVSTSENNLILSSFGHGVVDLSSGVVYDESNSPLVNINAGRNVLATAMEVDKDANIWVSQIGQNSILKFTPDKNWEAFDLGIVAARNPQNIKLDGNGQIWIRPQSNFSGLVGYNPETKEVRYFTTTNGELPNSKITDMEVDVGGQLWVGTTSGVAYLPFTFGVLEDNSVNFIEPIFDNRVLFDDEQINAIEVDAGNRKWIATNAGLWLFEEDGDKLVHNFTTENSPLPSNTITEIKADPKTGEVFIATNNGLVSFRSDAVEGKAFHQNVKIFPNPVTPGYNGMIGISGLAYNVTLKITDVSGKLVREINSAGGGASWNAADYNGVRVQTGVYLVFSSNDEGTETFVGKIAVVN